MHITENTMGVLKNFATINQSLFIRKTDGGKKVITTLSGAENIIAKATVDESFPQDIAIYDLNEFLNTLSLFNEPQLGFDSDSFMAIKEKNGRTSCKYMYAPVEIMKKAPEDGLKMPSVDVEFVLSEANLAQIVKASTVMGLEDVTIKAEGTEIVLAIHDKKNPTSNTFDLVVGECAEGTSFNVDFKIDNFKFVEDGYKVEISTKMLSHFVGLVQGMEYWVAIESSSTFG